MSTDTRDVVISIIECCTNTITLSICVTLAIVIAILFLGFIGSAELVVKTFGISASRVWAAHAGRRTINAQLGADIARAIAAITATE